MATNEGDLERIRFWLNEKHTAVAVVLVDNHFWKIDVFNGLKFIPPPSAEAVGHRLLTAPDWLMQQIRQEA